MVNHWYVPEDDETACHDHSGETAAAVSVNTVGAVSCPECRDAMGFRTPIVALVDTDPCIDCGHAEDYVCPPQDGRSTIATEAQAAVYGDRGKDYGHPRDNFADAAAMWSVLLHHPVTAEDVARCMIAIKLARDIHTPKRDNRVDIAGYAITLDRLDTGA